MLMLMSAMMAGAQTAPPKPAPARPVKDARPVGVSGMSSVNLRGSRLTGVTRVRMDARARVVLFHSVGVASADVGALPVPFLESWGIDKERIAAAKAKDVPAARHGAPKSGGRADTADDLWAEMWSDFPAATVSRLVRTGGFDRQMVRLSGRIGRMSQTDGVRSFDLMDGDTTVRVALVMYGEAAAHNASFVEKIAQLEALPQDFSRSLAVVGEVSRAAGGGPVYLELVDFRVLP
jgi:hypothetical protein